MSRRGRPSRSKIVSLAVERPPGVALRPGLGEREGRRLGDGGDEQLHLALADRLVAGPERELVDLVRELVEVLADELDERRARPPARRGRRPA